MSIEKQLAAPFPADQVHWRVGSRSRDKKKGMALAYIDARNVMERLDAVVGTEGWETSFTETPSGRVICRLSLRVGIDAAWVTKSDGAGDTGTEGEKGAISDALKRAAVQWGIGRYLYAIDSPWVELVDEKWLPRDFDGSRYLPTSEALTGVSESSFLTLYQASTEIKRHAITGNAEKTANAWKILDAGDKKTVWPTFTDEEQEFIKQAMK
ncbi:MAG: hypothetical protein GY938_00715 [Ketobacter sp.]|nr:hypothetical protein [Ketobacter sp.]